MRGAFDTITIWNKYSDASTNKDVFFRSVVKGCSYEQKSVRAVSGQTASVAGTTGVLIAENPNYKPAKEWAAGDKTAFFTLQTGDLVARGEHSDEITGISPNTESAVRQRLMPEVFTIRVVQDNTAGYKRGRHLFVEGV